MSSGSCLMRFYRTSSKMQAGLEIIFVGDEIMSELFEYPPSGWNSESDKDASFLTLYVHKWASRVGFEATIVGQTLLYFAGLHIEFLRKDYGCTLLVRYEDKEKIFKGFDLYWKFLIEHDICWGGPYKKSIQNDQIVVYDKWKKMPKSSDIEKKVVELWCTTDKIQPEIGDEIGITSQSVANILTTMRALYPELEIPLGGSDRNKFVTKYKVFKAINKTG